MSLPCKKLNKENSKENVFEPTCATVAFKKNITSWDIINVEYLNHINRINDPILKYISMYFVKYYIDGYNYYKNSENTYRSEACRYLYGWLQEKKDLFTFGKKCAKNLNSWDDNIQKLWDMLKDVYTISDRNGTRPWCNIIELTLLTEFPSEVTIPKNCYESISQETYSEDPIPKAITTDCKCPEYEVAVSSQITDNTPDIQPTRKIAVTSSLTTAGTIGSLLLLYKYTPVSSWFRRRGMHNVGTDLYMNPGSADGFLRLQHDNGSNNLFYQP